MRGSKQEARPNNVEKVPSIAVDEDEEEEPEPVDSGEVASEQPLKKVDLSAFINDAFINELSDKNWKVR